MKKIIYFLAFLSAFLIFTNTSYATGEVTSNGKEFYIGFMPNLHQGSSNDSLYIFIGAEKPANVHIEYKDRYGTIYTKDIYISDPKTMIPFQVFWQDFEITGNYNNNFDNQNETISQNVFHITSDEDVSVYAHSEAETTSEAFNAFPVNALGKDYCILTYNSDGVGSSSDTPSQFLIIATEDGTIVNINPSSKTVVHRLNPQTINLQKGEAYLVQSYISNSETKNDLSGSFIKANKLIAVFAGHQRATIPVVRANTASPSRDCLMEQLPPIQSWGRNAFVVPFYQPISIDKSVSANSDIFRVLASNDSTDISINGVFIKTLNKGEFYEGKINSALSISASKPILTAQYKKTSNFNSSATSASDSDPLMLIIPPYEQYLNSYRFINIQANDGAYTHQYVNIVVADSSRDKVVLDGVTLDPKSFLPIPNSNYYYQIKNTANGSIPGDGIHTISCPDKIGIFVYGFGLATSYGYGAGMSFKSLDLMAPRIVDVFNCFSTNGKILENAVSDVGLKTAFAPNGTLINTVVTIDNFNLGDTSVAYHANLQNIYEDGSFYIEASDKLDQSMRKKIDIPGFTLSSSIDKSVTTLTDTVAGGSTTCLKYKIYNYGSFQQKIETLNFKSGSRYTINKTPPIYVNPGANEEIEICISDTSGKEIIDSLIIGNLCAERLIGTFSLVFAQDVYKPEINSTIDPCNINFDLTFTESHKIDMGIKTFTVDSVFNFKIISKNENTAISNIKFERIDPLNEAYIKVTCIDKNGNKAVFEKLIPGFTISIMGMDLSLIKRDLGSMPIGSIKCDSLSLFNYGSFDFTINNAKLFSNTLYSIPPSQFPMLIPPKSERKLAVCFAPYYTQKAKFYDTLEISYNCLTKLIQFESSPTALSFDISSECNTDITAKSAKAVINGYSINAVYPQPITNSAMIKIEAPIDSYADAYLYDIYGRKIALLFTNLNFKKGSNEIEINFEKFASGTYLLVIDANGNKIQKNIQIFK